MGKQWPKIAKNPALVIKYNWSNPSKLLKTISKIYDKNFFTDYCYRYWLDIKEKEFNGEYVYDLHPTERAAKEWASLLLNHIEDER